MAKKIHLQVPASVHCLAQLLEKLGYICGPMKAAQTRDNQIDIWFVFGAIKRVSARLVRGVAEVTSGSPRRVYLDIRVQRPGGVWYDITDEDFVAARLEEPWRYDGPQADGEGDRMITFYRLLPGDLDCAIADAEIQEAE